MHLAGLVWPRTGANGMYQGADVVNCGQDPLFLLLFAIRKRISVRVSKTTFVVIFVARRRSLEAGI